MRRMIFGLYEDGKLLYQIGLPVVCTPEAACLIVEILFGHYVPTGKEYFACDYERR